jgi:AraC-like DNA-binding protein
MDLDPWAPRDPLGEALHVLRVSGAYYCRSELTAPWGMSLPAMKGYMWFHVVTDGACWLDTDGSDLQFLRPGDFALVPHGQGHTLRSEPMTPAPLILDLPLERISDRYEVLRHGGGGTRTSLICAAIRLADPAGHDLVKAMPAIISVPSPGSLASEEVHIALRLMAAEARSRRPGGETMITRLADVLVVEAIRSWLDRDPGARTGWLGALRDPQIGAPIALIHRDPARPWTVASLAREAAMSRSAFAARFTELVGEPPMRYLARWRMHVALGWLTAGEMTASEAAHRLGYASEAAFNRAFKRTIGMPPGSVRRTRDGARDLAERADVLAWQARS